MEDSSHEQPDQEAPKILTLYSITLSARRRIECGMVRPRALAVFITLVGQPDEVALSSAA